MTDLRIAYGTSCTWWDSIEKVGRTRPEEPEIGSFLSLPCCPHCGGMLLEAADDAEWFSSVDQYEVNGNPGYRARVEWSRGKCFRNYAEAKAAYESSEKVA